MILLDQYISFIIANKLTQDQYLLLHLLKDERMDLIQKYKEAFPTEEGTMISKLAIKNLVEKGFLIKTKTGWKLADKLLNIFVTPEKAVDEIYDIYPPFIESERGVSIPLNSMDKSIFKAIYIPKIMGNVEEHKEVIKDIQYAVENHLIKIGINKFLTSEQWKVFRKLRLQENTPTITQNEDDF